MKLTLSKDPINTADLSELERNIGLEIPQSFKNFYLENNGGIPSYKYIDSSSIRRFLPIKYGKKTIESRLFLMRNGDMIPTHFIPFAIDPGSWTFCLDLSASNYGAVYLVRTDGEENILIATSFEELLNKLSLVDDY